MSEAVIAQPYAVAAMAHSRETNSVAAWGDFFNQLAHSEEAICTAVQQNSGDETPLADALCDLLKIKDTGQRNFLHVVAQNQRLACIGEMARAFAELQSEAENIAEMQVEAAKPLSSSQKKDLEESLAKWSGKSVRATYVDNADLLGGVRVRYKDHVWDASVLGRLERLQAEFSAGA